MNNKKNRRRVFFAVAISLLLILLVVSLFDYGLRPPPIGMSDLYTFELPADNEHQQETPQPSTLAARFRSLDDLRLVDFLRRHMSLNQPQVIAAAPQASNVVFVRELPNGKTWWDWLELLIVPAILLALGYIVNERQLSQTTRIEQLDNYLRQRQESQTSQEETLQRFLDGLTALALSGGLFDEDPSVGVRQLARARTLATLRNLEDGNNKRIVLQFLRDTGLIARQFSKVSLSGADLKSIDGQECDLSQTNLAGAKLVGAKLRKAKLSDAEFGGAELRAAVLQGAVLTGANLSKANLSSAKLSNACLDDADLSEANLAKADLRGAQLGTAILANANLEEVRYSTTTTWPTDFDIPDSAEQLEDRDETAA